MSVREATASERERASLPGNTRDTTKGNSRRADGMRKAMIRRLVNRLLDWWLRRYRRRPTSTLRHRRDRARATRLPRFLSAPWIRLSAVLREAWRTGNFSTLTKNSPLAEGTRRLRPVVKGVS
jgi:hypothetical protein